MPVVIGRDGETHLTTFAESTIAICGELTAETGPRIGDLAVTHEMCRMINAARQGALRVPEPEPSLFGGRYFEPDYNPLT